MTILEIIKLRLPADKQISDELLEVYVSTVTQRILNYINRRLMPSELELDVLIPMVLAMVMGKDSSTSNIVEKAQEVSSISEGGASVSFKAANASEISAMFDLQKEFYKDQLNGKRRLI